MVLLSIGSGQIFTWMDQNMHTTDTTLLTRRTLFDPTGRPRSEPLGVCASQPVQHLQSHKEDVSAGGYVWSRSPLRPLLRLQDRPGTWVAWYRGTVGCWRIVVNGLRCGGDVGNVWSFPRLLWCELSSHKCLFMTSVTVDSNRWK